MDFTSEKGIWNFVPVLALFAWVLLHVAGKSSRGFFVACQGKQGTVLMLSGRQPNFDLGRALMGLIEEASCLPSTHLERSAFDVSWTTPPPYDLRNDTSTTYFFRRFCTRDPRLPFLQNYQQNNRLI